MFMDYFVFILANFSVINDYGGVGMVWIELKVNESRPKVRILMITQGLAFF